MSIVCGYFKYVPRHPATAATFREVQEESAPNHEPEMAKAKETGVERA
jgi:hypothetical protein